MRQIVYAFFDCQATLQRDSHVHGGRVQLLPVRQILHAKTSIDRAPKSVTSNHDQNAVQLYIHQQLKREYMNLRDFDSCSEFLSDLLDWSKIKDRVVLLENRLAQCLACSKVYKDIGKARRHYMEIHSEEAGGPFQCDLCDRFYTRKRSLTRHLKINHQQDFPM